MQCDGFRFNDPKLQSPRWQAEKIPLDDDARALTVFSLASWPCLDRALQVQELYFVSTTALRSTQDYKVYGSLTELWFSVKAMFSENFLQQMAL
jgi:hypothetical protein